MDLLTVLLPALLPAAADGVRGLFAKLTGSEGAKPQSVTEVIQLMEADTSRLVALAELDRAGNVSSWVANLRASSRYIAVWAALLQWPIVATFAPGHADTSAQFAQAAVFFLFGDRVYMHLRRDKPQ